MANQGAKRQVENNRKKLQLLQQLIFAVTAIYALVRLGVFYKSSATRHYVLLTLAKPTYENGELQHGGSDLDLKGSLPYYAVEVIYCLALLQILTALLSDKFWWLLLALPGWGLWLLWQYVLQPYFFSPSPEGVQETAVERRKREKLERKQNKVKYSKGRR
ncbi:MAG: transmembrane protein [Trebouxia sp. A1-2]|nr:MAG: transmembrane protein [Trebouxia sp. A1-2]